MNSADYQAIVKAYTNKKGEISYELLNRALIQAARSNPYMAELVARSASEAQIRDHVVKANFEAVTGNRAISQAEVPGVNYIGGSRQLRRRVPPSLPLPWQGDATPKTEPPAGLVVADTSARTCSGAREPADPTVRRQRGAHTGTWRQC